MFILNCAAFDGEFGFRHPNKCCTGDCHVSNTLIPVTPYAADATLDNRRLDWDLGIQGLVCCGRYEFVRALSREWWIDKGRRMGVLNEDAARKLLAAGSWHPTFDKVVKPKVVEKAKSADKCPECGARWNQVVCDSCGRIG